MKKITVISLTSLLLSWGLFSSPLAFAQEEVEYRFERLWPRLEQPWYFNQPSDIAIASDGSVYIADTQNDRILKFSAQGDFIQKWGERGEGDGQFKTPAGIAIAANGDVYVLDTWNNRVQHFNAEGHFLRAWGSFGTGDGQFITPTGIAIASDGSVYITDYLNNDISSNSNDELSRVQKFTALGEFILTWGSFGSGDGQFQSPQGIATAFDGSVYVADGGNNGYRIQKFNSEGVFISTWGSKGTGNGQFFDNPRGIAVAPDGSVYVTEEYGGRIQQFTGNGNFIRIWENQSIEKKPFSNHTRGITIASNGRVYIAVDSEIHQYSSEGDLVQAWRSSGIEAGKFIFPSAVEIGPNNNVYVADSGNQRIQQFSADGDFIRAWGSIGSGNGEFNNPKDIAVALNGSVYVADSGNQRIQQFSAEGDFIRTWGSMGVGDGQFSNNSSLGLESIAIASDGSVFAADYFGRIQKFSAEGEFILKWKIKEDRGVGASYSRHIAIAKNDTVYVYTAGGLSSQSRIEQYSANGDFIREWSSNGIEGVGIIQVATDLIVSSDGTVYVAVGDRIHRFSPEGIFIQTREQRGTGDGQFNAKGLAMDENDNLFVADANNRIQKFVLKIKGLTSHPYKAIILAGGGKTIAGRPNHIWDGTKRVTQKAYKALTRQAFKQHEEIKFLTAGNTQVDLDNNNKFDDLEVASKESLRLAITQWATDAADVVIYLANHGGPGKFQVNSNEILTGEELNVWVTQLEQVIPGTVTVIIEACNSAGFFDQLAKPKRYLFASAKSDQPAVISNGGLNSFSYYFWSEVATGAFLEPAFKTARQGMSDTLIDKQPQDAQAETDGNLVFNNQDLTTLNNYCLGNCNQTAAAAPDILPISGNNRTLNGEMAQDFTITVNHLQPLNRVWALVQRPDDISIDPNQPLNFEKIDLTCNTQDVCQGRYERFDLKGEYRLSFYAMDDNTDVSFPETIIINQTQGKLVIPTYYDDQRVTVYLRDVVVNGQHLQAALELQGDKFVVIAYSAAPKQYSPAAQFDANSGKLIIPHASVLGKDYQATFNYLGGLDFQLESAGLK